MTPPARVVTFGEIMLRLSPPGFERFLQTPSLLSAAAKPMSPSVSRNSVFTAPSSPLSRLTRSAMPR
jgi:hypothetical protein